EIGRLPAELKPDVPSLQCEHRRGTPGAGEMLASPAGDGSTAIAAADSDGKFLHGREYDDAFRLLDEILRDILGYIEDLFENGCAFLQPFSLLFLREQRLCQHYHDPEQRHGLLHMRLFSSAMMLANNQESGLKTPPMPSSCS